MDWLWQSYERYKAQLFSYLASFFALRSKILDQRDRAENVLEKAKDRGDPVLIKAAQQMVNQVDQLYADQAAAENKVMKARDAISNVDAQKQDAGLGVLPLAALGAAAAVIVAAVSAVVIMFQRYSYLNRALDGLEKKVLTPGEYATAVGGGGFGLPSMGSLVLIAGVVAGGYFLLRRRR